MDEWKQRFKTYNITESDLPPYMLRQYRRVQKNWLSVYHLSNIYDEDEDDGIDQMERFMDYQSEFRNAVSNDDQCHDQCEGADETGSETGDKNEHSLTDDDDTATYVASTDEDNDDEDESTDDDDLDEDD